MTLFGFFHCSCVYESGHSLVSLHRSKAGAYKAMRRNILAQWEDHFGVSKTHIHMGRGHWEYWRHMKPMDSMLWTVKAVEVLD